MKKLDANVRSLKLKAKKIRKQGFATGMLKRNTGEFIPVYLRGNEVDKFLKQYGDKSEVELHIGDLKLNTKIVEVHRNILNHNAINVDFHEI